MICLIKSYKVLINLSIKPSPPISSSIVVEGMSGSVVDEDSSNSVVVVWYIVFEVDESEIPETVANSIDPTPPLIGSFVLSDSVDLGGGGHTTRCNEIIKTATLTINNDFIFVIFLVVLIF